MKSNKIPLLSSFMGNALEFYDFTLYGIFANLLSSIFFPSSNPTLSIIASWATFSAALFMRPFGALIFGFIGDIFGRKKALSLSILLMAVPTLIVACLPTYLQIGVMSPVVLIVCRIVQGIAMGGEYNGSAIFALEHFENKRPGLIGGIITSSGALGALLATFFGSLAVNSDYSFMWRIPFLIGGLTGIIIFGLRFWLHETPAYLNEAMISTKKDTSFNFIFNHYKMFFANFSSGALNGCLAYILFGFSIMYLNRYCHVDLQLAMKCNMVGLFLFMIFNPIAGMAFDRLGYVKYFYAALALICISIVPVFLLLQASSTINIVVGFMMLGILTASIAGPCHAFMQVYVPVSIRYRSVALSFSLGMGIFGGGTPIMLTILLEKSGNLNAPVYLILMVTFGYYLLVNNFIKSMNINLKKREGLHGIKVINGIDI